MASGYVASSSYDYVRPENASEAVIDREKARALNRPDVEAKVASGELAFGNAKEVTERLIEQAEAVGANKLLINVNFGAMPNDLFMEQVRRFGREVLPKLQAHQVTRIPAMEMVVYVARMQRSEIRVAIPAFRSLHAGYGGAPCRSGNPCSAAAASESEAKASAPVEYNGFTIRAAPYKAEGQYQTAGVITKDVGGVAKEHKFIRADRHASYDDAVEFSLAKARQIVDQQGERMFG